MRRKKNNLRKEKIIMISASAFVLTALTMAGVYVREQSKENDEYRVDLGELDHQSVADKTSEIAENLEENQDSLIVADDLDADPDFWEVGSTGVEANIENSWEEKVTAEEAGENNSNIAQSETEADSLAQGEEANADVEAGAENVVMANYNFPTLMKMEWPLYGNLTMNYSMDKTVYFETLGQYRYNPALMIKADVGTEVRASANGIVKEVGQSTELGNILVLDMGEGYELTYGQLDNITVKAGDVVEMNQVIGTVAEPSVYYTMEGSNLYIKLTKDGVVMNPMEVLP